MRNAGCAVLIDEETANEAIQRKWPIEFVRFAGGDIVGKHPA
jgi:hypothetical protein